MRDPFPKHPASEAKAALFHGAIAVVYAALIPLYVLGCWFHAVSAVRHARER